MNGTATTIWATQVKPSFPLHSFLLFIGGFTFLVLVACLPAIILKLNKCFTTRK
jgi:hypothetical protein